MSRHQTPNLETRLALLFPTMERRKASMRQEAENAKLSRRRFWWQDQPNENDEKA